MMSDYQILRAAGWTLVIVLISALGAHGGEEPSAAARRVLSSAALFGGDSRPNIVFLLTDNQRWDLLGCMGNPSIITPNIDRLAADGVLFENAFHAVPICQPSRATFMTGQYLNTHMCGFDRPTDYVISRPELEKTYPLLLRKAGYRTGFVGKWGFGVMDQKIRNVTFDADERLARTQIWKQEKYMPKGAFDFWAGYAGFESYEVKVGDKTVHRTEYHGDKTIEFIEDCATNHSGKPFVIQVSFRAPHNPPIPAKRHLDMYANIEIPRVAASSRMDYETLPNVVKRHYRGSPGFTGKTYRIPVNPLKPHHALITGADEVVGRVREALEKNGLAENTIIIFSSDNGRFNEYKLLFGLELLYEPSIRAPLIVFDPRLPKSRAGSRVKGLVSTVDFAQTFLDYAEVPAPDSMQGVSFRPLASGEKESIRDQIFSENNFSSYQKPAEHADDEQERQQILEQGTVRSKCIRTLEWKYIRYYETKPLVEELFAIDRDPWELNNLAGKSQHAKVLNSMRAAYDAMVAETAKARVPVVESKRAEAAERRLECPLDLSAVEYSGDVNLESSSGGP